VAAGDLERDHDAITWSEVADPITNLFDDSDGLVTEDVPFSEKRPEHLV
jgi:hypothetical protein